MDSHPKQGSCDSISVPNGVLIGDAAGQLLRVPFVEWNFAQVEEGQLILCSVLNGWLVRRK